MAEYQWADGKTGTISLVDKEIEVVSYGPPPNKAPTIVMLHEGLGSIQLWRDFPQMLAQATGYGVFVYSRPGNGFSDFSESPRPLDYMTKEALTVLPRVLNAIEFESGILLGHSDGASIASIYAGTVEDFRIRGLVLMAPHFFTEPSGLASIQEIKSAYEAGDLKSRMSKYHKDVDHTFYGWNDAWLNEKFKKWNIAENIDYWRVPVLAIQGADDQYGTLAQINEIDSRIYSPLDIEIIENCKHSPHIEHPQQTLYAVTDFCLRLNQIEKQVVNH